MVAKKISQRNSKLQSISGEPTDDMAIAVQHRSPSEMCRFSDAGNDEARHTLGDRRLKSAEARNRGEVGHRRCRGLYGDLAAALGWGGWIKAPAPIGLPSQDGCG